MNEISAFVGHSFLEQDTHVVNAFLKYFDQLRRLHPTFSWEHAEAAEPKQLADKVLALIQNKNVFIGICTARECAVDRTQLSEVGFTGNYCKARKESLRSKTSDWVIQEIGLAKGRGMELVLLLEDGIREPGGLQGDVEYIRFTRDAPERCFGKVVEMLTALSPRPAEGTAASGDLNTTNAVEKNEDEEQPNTNDLQMPQPNWSIDEYDDAMRRCLIAGDEGHLAIINESYLATDHARQDDNIALWQARVERTRLQHDRNGSLSKLRELATAHPTNGRIQANFAIGLTHYDDHLSAAKVYEAAADVEKEIDRELYYIGSAVVSYAKAGDTEESSRLLQRLKERAHFDSKGEQDVLETLMKLADIADDADTSIAAMERMVELSPEDTGTRFSLAYKYSKAGNRELAIYHYLRIPHADRSSFAWNNLGVAFERFELPIKSVNAYREAKSKGNTLAMSNLANKFLDAGFLAEARAECVRAMQLPAFHGNVGNSHARIESATEEEDEKEKELLKKARLKIDFYRILGQAVVDKEPGELHAQWRGPGYELASRVVDGRFVASGKYKVSGNALGVSTNANPLEFLIEFSGRIAGRTVGGHVTRRRADSTTLLSADNESKTFLMVFDVDGSTIQVLENTGSGASRIYQLTKMI